MTIRVFISHSSQDEAIAETLAVLLEKSIGLAKNEIRCSSVTGYKISVGKNYDELLQNEAVNSTVFIGLVTHQSLKSSYVLFEMGARWGARRSLFPVLAGGTTTADLPGPLARLAAASVHSEAEIHRLLRSVAQELDLRTQPQDSYSEALTRVIELQRPSRAADPSSKLRKLCEDVYHEINDFYVDSIGEGIRAHHLLNARRPKGYVKEGEKVIALILTSTRGEDGIAILDTGVSWRNRHSEPSSRRAWSELAKVEISHERTLVRIGREKIHLSGGQAKPRLVAELLKSLTEAALHK